jgi:hypothetical protein
MKTRLIIFCCFLLFSCKEKEKPQFIYFSISDVGAISGRITTRTGDIAVSGALITTTPSTHKVYSDSSGNYTLPDMPPGDYTIKVSRTGYLPDSTTVSLIDWRTVKVDFSLSIIQILPGFSFTGLWIGSIGPYFQDHSMVMNLLQVGNDSITGNMIISDSGIPNYMTDPNITFIQSALYFENYSFSFNTYIKNFLTGGRIPGKISGKLIVYRILTGNYYFVSENGVPFDLPFYVQKSNK